MGNVIHSRRPLHTHPSLAACQGIYPTVIIVLVCLQKAHQDTFGFDAHIVSFRSSSTEPNSPVHFSANPALGPAAPRRAHSHRRESIPIRFSVASPRESGWVDLPVMRKEEPSLVGLAM